MTNKVLLLNRASGFFFFAGFVTAKIQLLPIVMVSSVLNIISLVFNSIGYAIWYLASQFYPEQTLQKSDWYSFAQFKEQHTFAATLGLLATILSFAALTNPILFVPVAWLYLSSNLMWTLGEYHKLKNPPIDDPNYSNSYQNVYLSYAMVLTGITVAAAINATLLVLLPTFAMPILITTTIAIIGLSALALELWLDYSCNNYPPTSKNNSYHQMSEELGEGNEPAHVHDQAPYHGHSPLQSPKNTVPAPVNKESPDPQSCPVP